MDREIQMRLGWVQLYEETQNAGFVCRRCGVSRPTLRKWIRRYKANGINGLQSQSRRPHHSPNIKIGDKEKTLILKLRKTRKLGARRIQNELFRLHDLSLSLATIHKVPSTSKVKPLVKRRLKIEYKRYSRPIPSDRAQMDTCKIEQA